MRYKKIWIRTVGWNPKSNFHFVPKPCSFYTANLQVPYCIPKCTCNGSRKLNVVTLFFAHIIVVDTSIEGNS